MVKFVIVALAALGYVHYVHVASLAVNRRLENIKQAYTSVAEQPEASLTMLQK